MEDKINALEANLRFDEMVPMALKTSADSDYLKTLFLVDLQHTSFPGKLTGASAQI